jgi:radical SAM superfamily enzyme YgiQ (UPF0313 family)
MKAMNVLFVRPPRHYWPLLSPAGAFWQPLAFACLAAAVRRDLPQATVGVLDAPILKMGWRSIETTLAAARPDVVCIGDEVSASGEGLRLAHLARSQNPQVCIIAGGHFFGPMAPEILAEQPVDFVVRGEGERTLVAVLQRLIDAGSVDAARAGEVIPGAVFRAADGRIVDGGMPELIDYLDTLPLPAWDLLPMPLYGARARSHRLMATLEHSRGCVGSGSFCNLWRQMGQPAVTGDEVRPRYRTKSPERSFEEVRLLYEKFGRRTFCWTDPTWNGSPEWTNRFCDLVLAWGRPIEMVAWLRADGIVRDAATGLLDKQVAAGLRRVMIGLERPSEAELAALGKCGCGPEVSRQALELLGGYSQVYTIASLLFGLPDESPESASALVRYAGLADATVIMPLTPNPGTPEWRAARQSGDLTCTDYSHYNFLNPILRTRRYSLTQVRRLYGRTMARYSLRRVGYWLRQLFRPGNRARAGLDVRLGWRAARLAAKGLFSRGPILETRPRWYDD